MQIQKQILERFWSKVSFGEDCWCWKAQVNSSGYGQFRPSRKDIRERGAHRFMWMVCYGEIPRGKFVCHKCDNTSCVNPAHFFLGDNRSNALDMMNKGRQVIRYGEEHICAKLTNDEALEIRRLRNTGLTYYQLAQEFEISQREVVLIVQNKRFVSEKIALNKKEDSDGPH